MIEITKDNFEAEVTQSSLPVVLDFWGPQCGPWAANARIASPATRSIWKPSLPAPRR